MEDIGCGGKMAGQRHDGSGGFIDGGEVDGVASQGLWETAEFRKCPEALVESIFFRIFLKNAIRKAVGNVSEPHDICLQAIGNGEQDVLFGFKLRVHIDVMEILPNIEAAFVESGRG